MRIGIVALSLIMTSLARADVSLTMRVAGPTTLDLTWSAGNPYYKVYRASSPVGIASPANQITFTSATSYSDTSVPNGIVYYLVTDGHCTVNADCQTGNPCADGVCNLGDCGVNFVPSGTVSPIQAAGDCATSVCDGSGGSTQIVDDTDVPVDGNSCTEDLCTAGLPSNPPLPERSDCTDGGDGYWCENTVCSPALSVVRVGDGAAALTAASAPVRIDQYSTAGELIGWSWLPTTTEGIHKPCTLSGTGTSEGGLSRSEDGRLVLLGAYGTGTGVANVAGTNASSVNRVICSMDRLGTLDSSTWLGGAFNNGSIRSAVTVDGSRYWVSGSSGAQTAGGIWTIANGAHGGFPILLSPDDMRWLGILFDQLYADTAASPYYSVFEVGDGLPIVPTSGLAVGPPAGPGASPFGFAIQKLNPNVIGLDTLYIADDRALASGGGIQKWTWDNVKWTLAATFTNGLATGVRGLAATLRPDGTVWLFATTAEATQNQLVRFIDDGIDTNPAATKLVTAPANMVFRGVAFSPHF